MDDASLRIKFTPLFKNGLVNGSKCCLEIVPEVSCLQNIDKILWKKEQDFIEYTIPMTYKVILKKQESRNEKKNALKVDTLELEKTYHSCVDLLPSSSMTAYDFASGDVPRMISDTYILGKILANFDDYKPALNNPVSSIKTNVDKVDPNYSPEELPLSKHNIHAQTIDVRTDNANSRHIVSEPSEQTFFEKDSSNKVTNTEKSLALCKITATQSVETTTELLLSTSSRDDSKRKLSLSPICSLNTNDIPFPTTAEKLPLNSIVDRFFQYESDIDDKVKPPSRNKKELNIITINDANGSLMSFCEPRRRELPEARVAKFVKKMETEIMPLKMMLNDIMQKCSSLGLNKNKYISRNLILYKTLPKFPISTNHVEKCCKTEKQINSNRVVYSIVFEG